MKFIEKRIEPDRIYLVVCGIKIYSVANLENGIIDFNTLPKTEKLESENRIEYQKITLIYSVYYQHNNFSAFYDTLKIYNNYSDEIKKHLEIIIVDDGSKYPLNLPSEINLNITLLRITKDIKWNSCGGRNLGVCYSSTKKILCMDIDWIVVEDTLKNLIYKKFNDDEFIVFDSIVEEWVQKGEKCELIPPNIYATLKSTFMKYNGYDEDIAGFYGDDIFFRKYLLQNNVKFIRYGTIKGKIKGAGEHNLSRNLFRVKKYMEKKKEHTRVMLNFPWMFVTEKHYIEIKK